MRSDGQWTTEITLDLLLNRKYGLTPYVPPSYVTIFSSIKNNILFDILDACNNITRKNVQSGTLFT